MRAPHPSFRQQDLDYRQGLNTLRRGALPIALATVLVAAATYAYEARQPDVYASVSSVLAAQDASQNTLINNTLVTAPPLPLGAVDQAIHSQDVVNDVTAQLKTSSLPAADVARLSGLLNLEIRAQKFRLIDVTDKLDSQQRGTYELRAIGTSPEEAQVLADAAAQALLRWDTARAQTGVGRAKASLQAQVADLTARIRSAAAGSPERDALVSTLGQVSQNLAQVGVFEKAASGPLTLVSAANRPLLPVSPKPKRNALLAGLLALLLASGAVLGREMLRRRVNAPEDLRAFSAPVLGELPRIPGTTSAGSYLNSAMNGPTYEAVGYLRIPLEELKPRFDQRRLVISSARPGEGKSSVAASLAQSFALSGQRVLIIDADTHRPTQQNLWGLGDTSAPNLLTISRANLTQARPAKVADNIDLIPAGPAHNGPGLLTQQAFGPVLDRWATGYDVVVIDTPPLLSVSDALSVTRFTDGLLFVIEAGKTTESEVSRALQTLNASAPSLIGFILNKATARTSGYQVYGYAYSRTQGNDPGPAAQTGESAT